jgi:uncharacterized OB-fold protein
MANSTRQLWTRPKPNIDAEIAPFWKGCAEHRLMMMRCKVCGDWYWPATYCRKDHGSSKLFGTMEWQTASGRGTVGEFNIHYVPFDPSFKEDIPYVYAMIQTEEGPYLSGNVVGIDPKQVRIGMPVQVTFLDVVDENGVEYSIPQWQAVATKS